jgi:hypothetical protein
MKIIMQEAKSVSDLTVSDWQVAIVGASVDDRGAAAVQFANSHAREVHSIDYDETNFEIVLDDKRFNAEALVDRLDVLDGKSVLLEATTLGFVQIFLCCRALRLRGHKAIGLIYVEPLAYSNPRRSHVLHKRDFELSETVSGYRAIPGATFLLSDRRPRHGVFFLGYEESRLDVALEDLEMFDPASCSVVFGVPAFKPGWEMNAFANNIRVIRSKAVSGGTHFCGAENPAAAVDVLDDIRGSLPPGSKMFVAPIGTKPTGIGAALFAAEHPDVGILYDHPRRRTGRSREVSSWHLYRAEF